MFDNPHDLGGPPKLGWPDYLFLVLLIAPFLYFALRH